MMTILVHPAQKFSEFVAAHLFVTIDLTLVLFNVAFILSILSWLAR